MPLTHTPLRVVILEGLEHVAAFDPTGGTIAFISAFATWCYEYTTAVRSIAGLIRNQEVARTITDGMTASNDPIDALCGQAMGRIIGRPGGDYSRSYMDLNDHFIISATLHIQAKRLEEPGSSISALKETLQARARTEGKSKKKHGIRNDTVVKEYLVRSVVQQSGQVGAPAVAAQVAAAAVTEVGFSIARARRLLPIVRYLGEGVLLFMALETTPWRG